MASSSGTKRAHTTLPIETKVEILGQIGKSYKHLSLEYGVGISTISDIKKNGENLKDYKRKMVEMGCSRAAKVMRSGKKHGVG